MSQKQIKYFCFLRWLDKLGMSARDGVNMVLRQSFYGYNYGLIDNNTLNPNPVSYFFFL